MVRTVVPKLKFDRLKSYLWNYGGHVRIFARVSFCCEAFLTWSKLRHDWVPSIRQWVVRTDLGRVLQPRMLRNQTFVAIV